MARSATDSVLIFRKYLLAYSETFIADQGRFLSRYQPAYAGFSHDSSGLQLLQNMPFYILDDYVAYTGLGKLAYRLGRPAKQWLSAIENRSVNVLHAHFLNDGLDALQLKKRLRLPLITTLHGHDITKREKTSLFKSSRSQLFARCDRFIAVSDYIYQCALASGCPEERLLKHSIGINLELFSQPKAESAAPELLFVGRLVEKKGCVYLLQAMKQLTRQFKDLKLVIVGDGPLRASLQQQAAADKLNVEFVGKESAKAIRDRLSKAWVFVAPSITADNGDAEGLGMVFLEAQALQTPVVSFASGGVVEAVEHERSGLLSAEKDVAALVEHIEYFLNDETARRQYGQQGRRRVEDKFDVIKQCVLLEKIYDSVR
jgi:glycosyltransferase involved in cell wall biosynthesis